MWSTLAVIGGILLVAMLFFWLKKRRAKRTFAYRGGVPNAMARRELLYETSVTAEQKIKIGEQYLQEDYPQEALEFFGYADHSAGLEQIKKIALPTGLLPVLS